MQLKSHLSDANLCQAPDYWQGLQMLAELLSCHEIRDADRWFIQHVDIAHKHWQGLCWLWFFVTTWPICNQYVVRTDMDFTNLVLRPRWGWNPIVLGSIVEEIRRYKMAYWQHSNETTSQGRTIIKWLNNQEFFWQKAIETNPLFPEPWLILRNQTSEYAKNGILGQNPVANLQWFITQQMLHSCAQQIGLDEQTTEMLLNQISQGIV